MKLIITALACTLSTSLFSQISGIPVQPPVPQSAPKAIATEQSAAPLQTPVSVPVNPVAPVYPGAEPAVVVLPRDLVYPAAPPAPTQPGQREPIRPVDATNNLQPQQPQRDEASRENFTNGRPDSRIPDTRRSRNERAASTTLDGTTAVAVRPENRTPLPAAKAKTTTTTKVTAKKTTPQHQP